MRISDQVPRQVGQSDRQARLWGTALSELQLQLQSERQVQLRHAYHDTHLHPGPELVRANFSSCCRYVGHTLTHAMAIADRTCLPTGACRCIQMSLPKALSELSSL